MKRKLPLLLALTITTIAFVGCAGTARNSTNTAPEMNRSMEVAERAYALWRNGGQTGDWEPFLAMLTDDVVMQLPLPEPFRGPQRGIEAARAAFEFVASEDGLHVRVEQTPRPPLTDGTRFAFEFRARGTISNGQRVDIPQVVVFEVRGDRVSGVREYAGEP